MPMSYNTFGVGTVPPPPPPPPGYPPQPPGPPPSSGPVRNWPALLAAGVIGAVLASVAAAVVTVLVRDNTSEAAAPEVPAPITVTVCGAHTRIADPVACCGKPTAKRARRGSSQRRRPPSQRPTL